jgi:hypothetical protein
MSSARAGVWIDRRLLADPSDELIELDRLFRRDQRIFGRKPVFAGGLSSAGGGTG